MALQGGWRWCKLCQGLAHSALGDGVCPTGAGHDFSESGNYSVALGEVAPGAQGGWRWCKLCQGLAHSALGNGVCPTGAGHDFSESGNYSVALGEVAPGAQGGWRWCKLCQGLAHSALGNGVCPTGAGHDFSESGNYSVALVLPGREPAAAARFLLARGDDLVVLGVRWSGLQLHPSSESGGVPALTPLGGDASITLTFPPQHVGEEVVPVAPSTPVPTDWGWVGGQMSPQGSVAAVVHEGTEVVDLFAVTDNGALSWRTALGGGADPGADWRPVGPERFSSRTPIAAVARWPGSVDLFAIDETGTLLTRPFASVEAGGEWVPLMGGFAPGTPLTAVSRVRGDADVYAIKDAAAWHAWARSDGSRGTESLGGSFAPGTRAAAVVAVDSGPLDLHRLDTHLFAVDTSGNVSWRVPGSSWTSIGSPGGDGLPQGAHVAAVEGGERRIDAFVVGRDRAVWWKTLSRPLEGFSGGKAEWVEDADWRSLGGTFAPGAPISATTTPRFGQSPPDEVLSESPAPVPPFAVHLVLIDDDGRPCGATWSEDQWSVAVRGWVVLGHWLAPDVELAAVCAHSGGYYPDVSVDGEAVVRLDPSRVELFAIRSDRALRQLSWPGAYHTDSSTWQGSDAFHAEFVRRQARLAGPSSVAFKPEGTGPVQLTVSGVLDALRRGTLVEGTSIELPWRLRLSPAARSGAGPAVCRNATDAVRSGSGAVAAWHTAIVGRPTQSPGGPDRAAALSETDSGLDLTPVDGALADAPDDFVVGLAQRGRSRIFQLGRNAPAQAQRLELSSLGGTLSAHGSWSSLDWEHHAALGRDTRVRLESRGVLYPFGHQVSFFEITERSFDSRTSRAIAALHKRNTLLVTERVRGQAARSDLRRAFPFDTVEVIDQAFTGLGEADWVTYPRPRELVQLRRHLVALESELRDWEQFAADFGTDPWIAIADLNERVRVARERVRELEDGLAGDDPVDVPTALFFWPRTSEGELLRFSVSCTGEGVLGDARFSLPLMFVATPPPDEFTESGAAQRLADEWHDTGAGQVPLGGTSIDLVRGPQREAGDVHEVHRLNIVGVARGGGFRPRLGPEDAGVDAPADPADNWSFEVAVPALRRLLDVARPPVAVRYHPDFLSNGDVQDIVLLPLQAADIEADFTTRADRAGGLVAPRLVHDGFSRARGLVNSDALLGAAGEAVDPLKVLGSGSKLLGVPLREFIRSAKGPPSIVTLPSIDGRPTTRMQWSGITLDRKAPFEPIVPPDPPVPPTLALTIEVAPSGTTTTCTVRDFRLKLPPGYDLLTLTFGSLTFRQEPGRPAALGSTPRPTTAQPDPKFVGKLDVKVDFGSKLEFLDALQKRVQLGEAPQIAVSPAGITASYVLPVPDVQVGAFSLRNLVLRAAVAVPFTGGPTSLSLAFARPQNPFNLSVLMFGGGGYIEMVVDNEKMRRLEASLEFGASVAVRFGVAAGEVHALGGVRYAFTDLPAEGFKASLSGYFRFGGSVEVLGLVAVSIELRVELTYDDARKRLFGSATLVIEVDLTLISDSVEIPSGEWELIGGDPPPPSPPSADMPPDEAWPSAALAAAVSGARAGARGDLEAWKRYREAFAVA